VLDEAVCDYKRPVGVILTEKYLDFAHFSKAQQELIFAEHILIQPAKRTEHTDSERAICTTKFFDITVFG